jgi:hypothetical protein
MKRSLDYYEYNHLCEICWANQDPPDRSGISIDWLEINTHCIELRRNRIARKNKNVKPKQTDF